MPKHIEPIARIATDYREKFGIPRQSGLVPTAHGIITMEPAFRQPEALRGLEQFSHLWLIWGFSEHDTAPYSPTVRPPRLGGQLRVGVFATRSSFRPNGLALSVVRLEKIQTSPHGLQLVVSGVDMLDGTPIYDIKPYIPFTDCHPEATEGYTATTRQHRLKVECPETLLNEWSEAERRTILDTLSQDPRPTFLHAPDRIYGLTLGHRNIKFRIDGERLHILSAESTNGTKGTKHSSGSGIHLN